MIWLDTGPASRSMSCGEELLEEGKNEKCRVIDVHICTHSGHNK